MNRLRPRLTYANVMATVAVFIALGGASYAATQLPKNSVGAKQIRKGSITPSKLSASAKQALQGPVGPRGEVGPKGLPGEKGSPDTPADVLAKLLQTDGDGSSLDADQLDGNHASAFVKSEGAVFTDAEIPSVGDPCSANQPWQSELERPVGYYRDPFGFVHLRGTAVNCGQPGTVVAPLPPGYRPPATTWNPFVVNTTTVRALRISLQGSAFVPDDVDEPGTTVTLDGVYFRCGPSGEDGCP